MVLCISIHCNDFQEVDVAVGDLTMTSQRSSILDFSVPFLSPLVDVIKVVSALGT